VDETIDRRRLKMKRAHLEILKANVPLLVGTIRFVVDRDEVWEFVVGPHGDTIRRGDREDSLQRVEHARSIETYLPAGWAYDEFMCAWHYWAKGFEKGRTAERCDDMRRELARRERQRHVAVRDAP
jgi:hypothetical protein